MRCTVPCLAIGLVLAFVLNAGAEVTGYLTLGKDASNGSALPIQISCRKLNLKYGKGTIEASYDRNVKVTQGDVTLTCDHLVIIYDAKDAKPGQERRNPKLMKDMQTVTNMKSITASGNVKIVQGDRMAVAGKAVFDNTKRTIELSEGPKLWQGADKLIGEKIVIYIDESRSEVLAGDDKEIRMTISPGKHKKEQEK